MSRPLPIPPETLIRLLEAGPAGWTTLGALLGAKPSRAVMIVTVGAYRSWSHQ